MIWFNPPFSRNCTTNVAKRFLNLLDIHFRKLNKLHQIFNRNTVKVSYCCIENLSSIIKTHNKNVTNEKITPRYQRNCKNRNDCPLDGHCQTIDIIHKCFASTRVEAKHWTEPENSEKHPLNNQNFWNSVQVDKQLLS